VDSSVTPERLVIVPEKVAVSPATTGADRELTSRVITAAWTGRRLMPAVSARNSCTKHARNVNDTITPPLRLGRAWIMPLSPSFSTHYN